MPVKLLRATWDAALLRRKVRDRGYWLRITFLILLGLVVAQVLSEFAWWRTTTYRTYGLLLRAMQSAPQYPSWTAVVLIDDDDYWLGEWARRTPLKRATLAALLRQIHKAAPRVIALDVDLRAQRPDGSILTHSDYHVETQQLFAAIKELAATTPVVLPKTIGLDEGLQKFVIDADLFDGVPLGAKVVAGYTRVPADLRNLALPTSVNGQSISSLAAAAAMFVEPKAVAAARRRGGHDLPFSMFLQPQAYEHVTVRARDVLRGDVASLEKLKYKVVVVGGTWHREAYGRGDLTDNHLTPVGVMSGAFIHANYIEALLAQRTFSPIYHWVHYVIEVIFGVALAAVFIAARGPWKLLYLAVLVGLVAVMSLIAFQNLGTFFDGVPVLILLGGHAGFETIADWKRAHDAHQHCPARVTAESMKA